MYEYPSGKVIGGKCPKILMNKAETTFSITLIMKEGERSHMQ